MNTKLKNAGSWIDDLVPPAFQGWLRVLVIIVALRYVGIDVSPINDVIKGIAGEVDEAKAIGASNAASLADIEAMMERVYAERRKSWTLTNDLARIESKLDRLLSE
jgi:hypothetical protein